MCYGLGWDPTHKTDYENANILNEFELNNIDPQKKRDTHTQCTHQVNYSARKCREHVFLWQENKWDMPAAHTFLIIFQRTRPPLEIERANWTFSICWTFFPGDECVASKREKGIFRSVNTCAHRQCLERTASRTGEWWLFVWVAGKNRVHTFISPVHVPGHMSVIPFSMLCMLCRKRVVFFVFLLVLQWTLKFCLFSTSITMGSKACMVKNNLHKYMCPSCVSFVDGCRCCTRTSLFTSDQTIEFRWSLWVCAYICKRST